MIRSIDVWLKIIIVLSGIYILSKATPIYLPIIVSIILAFILNPMVDNLSQWQVKPLNRKLGRGFAILIAFTVASLVIAITVTFIVVPFIHEFDNLVKNFPGILKRLQRLTIVIQERVETIAIAKQLPNVFEQLTSSVTTFSIDLVRKIINSILNFATGIVEMVIVPVLTYYFLKDWKYIKESTVNLFSQRSRKKINSVIEEMGSVISGYIRGQFLVCVTIGVLVFCGMYSFGVEYPLVLGLLAALTESIPIVGSIIGAVPAVLLAYTVEPALALKVIVYYIVINQIENQIFVPKIMGSVIDLHPIAIIISLLIGGQLFGILGMIMAVPTAALLKVVLKHLWITEEDR